MSGTGRGPVELSAGCRLVLAGTQWQVREFEPQTGRVLLRRDDGQELATTIRALVNHGDCRPVPAAAAGLARSRGRQPAGLEDLTARQRELVAIALRAPDGGGDRLPQRQPAARPARRAAAGL